MLLACVRAARQYTAYRCTRAEGTRQDEPTNPDRRSLPPVLISRLRGPRRRAGLAAHDALDALALLLEARQHRAFEHAAARQADTHRIDEAAIDHDLVVDMRAGRQAGRADEADHLSLAYALARLDAARKRRHVAVGGLVAVVMLHAHVFAVAAFPAHLVDRAVAGSKDRRAVGRGPVNA